MTDCMKLKEKLLEEKRVGHRGGIYHKMQVDFAYNSNHIEGSRLTHDQTRYIYETKTVGTDGTKDAVRVNDIIETVNHFRCFDHILDTLGEPLTEGYIKDLHRRLKSGVMDRYAVIGEYKQEANEVGGMLTASPDEVGGKMHELLAGYGTEMTLYDVARFHMMYEKIHPFYDGNGRTGRLIIFKQCLENDIIPFFINDDDKMFYYMGLKEWQTSGSDERLINVFLAAQDYTKAVMEHFGIEYDRTFIEYKDIINKAK